MTLQGFDRVHGTTGMETAVAAQEWAQQGAVGAQQENQQGFHRSPSRQSIQQGIQFGPDHLPAGRPRRRHQPQHKIVLRQTGPAQPEGFASDPLDQVTQYRLFREFFRYDETDACTG
jgi:hypothetical protein